MTQTSPSPWRRLRRPLIALILGLLPFWVFLGSVQQTTVNGRLVQDSSFNILGILLAVIGLVMAIKMLRKDGSYGEYERWLPRTLLTVAAALVCLFQIGQAAGLYRVDAAKSIETLQSRLFGPSEPGSSKLAAQIDAETHKRVQERSAAADQVSLREDIATTMARIHGSATLYNLYAAACDGGPRRFVLDKVPALLSADDRAYVEQARTIAQQNQAAGFRCDRPVTREFMSKWLPLDVLRARDSLALQTAAYGSRYAGKDAAPAQTTLPRALGLPVDLGDSIEKAQTGLGTAQAPVAIDQAGNKKLVLADKGIELRFDPAGAVNFIAVRAPFQDSFLGIKIGDSRRTINRLLRESWIKAQPPYDEAAANNEILTRKKSPDVSMQWLDQRDGKDRRALAFLGPIYADYISEIQLIQYRQPN